MALGGAGAAAFGAYDDLAGSGGPPRLPRPPRRAAAGRGDHRRGEAGRHRRHRDRQRRALVAWLARGRDAQRRPGGGGANLLQPVRPAARPGHQGRGRLRRPARRGPGSDGVAAPLGAALALLPEDLGERAMLGDATATALGAMLGASAAGAVPVGPDRRCSPGSSALTAASEKVSFTKVIARTPALELAGHARPQASRTQPSGDRVVRDSAARAAAPGHDPGSAARIGRVSDARSRTGSRSAAGRGIGRAALLIGAITMLARVIGFGRQVVFAHTVQARVPGHRVHHREHGAEHHLRHRGGRRPHRGGGAGAGRSRAIRPRAGTADLRRAAHLAVCCCVPVSLVVAAIARAAGDRCCSAGRPGCPRAEHGDARRADAGGVRAADPALRTAGRGALTASCRRTAGSPRPRWRRCCPAWSSSARTSWFGVVGSGYQDLTWPVPAPAWIVLAVGTTAGVAALVATPLIPVARLRLRLRPRLRFPGIGVRVRSLAAACCRDAGSHRTPRWRW